MADLLHSFLHPFHLLSLFLPTLLPSLFLSFLVYLTTLLSCLGYERDNLLGYCAVQFDLSEVH